MNYQPPDKSDILKKSREIIHQNILNESFNVLNLALELGMSRTTLHRHLKYLTGRSASDFIRRVKLEKAMEMLEASPANISEIAYECGFHSIAYFDKCFRELYGHSPGQLRKKMKASLDSDTIIAVGSEVKSENGRDNSKPANQLHNFPVPLTSFIGRQKEISELHHLIRTNRLVSIVGPGGSGKTRLACETVRLMESVFEDGAWFVDLAPVESGELVEKKIMETLNIPENPGQDHMDTIVSRLGQSNLLMILDNCEHLAESCARIAGRLVKSLSEFKILITSRALLNIQGETIWRIPTLSIIKPEEIRDTGDTITTEAIQLFTDRAQMGDHRFKPVNGNIREIAGICQKLGGIPLAIELVSTRIRYMDPKMILDRLSGSFADIPTSDPATVERQKTLRATLEWSYKLLTTEEKTLFKRLAVFSGGFDLDAAEKVCSGAAVPLSYILDLLSGLVDNSMVDTIRIPGKPIRYYLLEPIRQFGAELIEEQEWSKIKRKHLDYFNQMAENAHRERLISQAYWIEKTNLERDNLQAALMWAKTNNTKKYAELAASLSWFWARNNMKQGRQVFENILANNYASTEIKAKILSHYAWIMIRFSDHSLNLFDLTKQSISIWHSLDNKIEEAIAITDLAIFYYGLGDDPSGISAAKKAWDLAKKTIDPGALTYSMMAVSQGFVNSRKFDEARLMAKRVLEAGIEHNILIAQFCGHHNRADCAIMEGKYSEAEIEYGKGVEVSLKWGDINYTYTDLTGVAMAVAGQGRYEKALRIMGAVNRATKKAGLSSPEEGSMVFWKELVQKYLKGTREKLGEELSQKYGEVGARMNIEETIAYALNVERD